MKIEVKAAMLILQDQLPMIGSGYRAVLYWTVKEKAYLFWMPTLSVYHVPPRMWTAIPRTERPDADMKARLRAIEINRSSARTRGAWDGGSRLERLIELLNGQEVDESAFEGEEASNVAAKMIPEIDFPFQEKDRVTLSYDKDFKGTIKRAGPEVSMIVPDGEKGKELNIPNHQIVKLPPEPGDVPAKTEEATDVGSATGKNRKKPAERAKAKAAAKEKKPSASPFAGKRIVLTVDKNPRAEGSLAHTRYAGMAARVKRNPGWSAQQILDACAEDKVPYRSIDLRADEERKSIKLVGL